jgi:hypothetical protein
MQQLATGSGGQYFNANTTTIDEVFTQITTVLSNEYTLTYTPSACTGSINLKVRVDNGGLYGIDTRTITLP